MGEVRMKKRTIFICSALLALAGIANGATVKADSLPAGMTSENTVEINHRTFVYNHKQTKNVNAKRKALIDAQNALSELKEKIKSEELATGGSQRLFQRTCRQS